MTERKYPASLLTIAYAWIGFAAVIALAIYGGAHIVFAL